MPASTQRPRSAPVWLWRAAPVLLLALGLGLAPVAQADDSVTSEVTVLAPGATAGAPVRIEHLGAAGWVTVDGSQAMLDSTTTLGVPFKSWTVDPSLYGQGQYRWVVDNIASNPSVWAVSDPFFMPVKGGLNLSEVIGPSAGAPIGRLPTTVLPILTLPIPVAQAPLLNATSSTQSTYCNNGDCSSAEISTYITGLPANSWIAVEWQDLQGFWYPVPNWEGPAYLSDPPVQLMYQQYAVLPELYGRGPFRWAVYASASGGVLGVSPAFNLPSGDRQNDIVYLSS